MDRIRLLDNPLQSYPWGSRTEIARLLGQPEPAAEPQAELWMGAHMRGPSRLVGEDETLAAAIERAPAAILGESVAARHAGRLPFLMKLLAAAEPLSIQAHPDREQAAAGFARENAAGIPVSDPRRLYPDPHHKPELLCALGPFWALSGFRDPADIRDQLARLGVEDLADPLAGGDLRAFVSALLKLPGTERAERLARALDAAEALDEGDGVGRWVRALHARHPGDIGVLAPAFLNLLRLEAGQALYQPARSFHSYLEGVGVEVMASSDNVLRGGLTRKPVAVDELLSVLRFESGAPRVIAPQERGPGESVYETPAEEFELSIRRVTPDRAWQSPARASVEIALCVEGAGSLIGPGAPLPFGRGSSWVAPACIGPYRIEGAATVYATSVPD